jgi:cytochrome P450
MLGVPTSDCDRLKEWSADFAEVLGNFQHNPDRASRTLKCVEEMTAYFREIIRQLRKSVPPAVAGGYMSSHANSPATAGGTDLCTRLREGLVNAFMTAEIEGDRLTERRI